MWPAALLLARWLWCHSWLLAGRRVLELGAGVGTAGLAAAVAGVRRVILTDINATALGLVRGRSWEGRAVQRRCSAAQAGRLLLHATAPRANLSV